MICELCSILFTHFGEECGDLLPYFFFGDFRQAALQAVVPAHVEMMGLIGMGNNPMVGATVACAVAVEEASK